MRTDGAPNKRRLSPLAAVAAVGVLTTAAIVGAALQPEEPELSGNAGYEEPHSTYRPGGSNCEPAAVEQLKGPARVRRIDACQDAAEQHRLNANDLIQQRRAADAAETSAVFAYEQTHIGAWSLALGFVTMFAAIAAAMYARDAAKETKRGADISEKSFSSLERPYLFVEAVEAPHPITRDWVNEPQPNNGFFDIHFKVRNYGRTPAILKELCGQVYIGDDLPNAPAYHPPDIHEYEWVIASGGEQSFYSFYRGKITPEMVGDLFLSRNYIEGHKPTRCYFFGYLKYESVYGAIDSVGFCWEFLVINNFLLQQEIENYTFRRQGIQQRGDEK